MRIFFITLFCCLFFTTSQADQTFNSGNRQTTLIELYSSQGCSSCPPAERWISRLKNHPQLWTHLIPVVFHVDYWDYLGWKDPYSSKRYSQRQRLYHQQKSIRSVYTPGFTVNGKEWRGWFRGNSFSTEIQQAKNLTATLVSNTLTVNYNNQGIYKFNAVLLASDQLTKIERGENAGKDVTEDFIVIDYMEAIGNSAKWEISQEQLKTSSRERLAIAVWVSSVDSLSPLQATGGWLE